MNCPLCECGECIEVARDARRPYFSCSKCSLVFVPAEFHCTIDDERRRYDLHDNSAANSGYVRFLTDVADIAAAQPFENARMLDFGCGKEGVLSGLLTDRGIRCDRYDPLFDYPLSVPGTRYDVVILCEVIEHCRRVWQTLHDVSSLLSESGIVIIRTQCLPPGVAITRWWYAQDITHVNFFSHRALETAASILGRRLEGTAADDIFIIR